MNSPYANRPYDQGWKACADGRPERAPATWPEAMRKAWANGYRDCRLNGYAKPEPATMSRVDKIRLAISLLSAACAPVASTKSKNLCSELLRDLGFQGDPMGHRVGYVADWLVAELRKELL